MAVISGDVLESNVPVSKSSAESHEYLSYKTKGAWKCAELLYTGKILPPFYFCPFRPLKGKFKTGLNKLYLKDYVTKFERG